MSLNLGDIVKGKVTGITKFGAFIALPEGKSGMVHISEVSKSYVTDIHDFLTEGDMVDVKVIHVDDAGGIHVAWSNGSTLAALHGIDRIRRID